MEIGPLENVSCELCGNNDLRLIITEEWFDYEFNVVRCKHCKLMFTNPRPTRQWKERFYDPEFNEYLKEDQKEFCYQPENPASRSELPVWDYLKQQFPARGKLLDCGCSSGLFVKAALQHGFEASGFDYSKAAIAQATSDGLDAFQAHVDEIPVDDNTYDVVTLIQVVEHFDHPLLAMKELRRVLKPGGMLYMETVNYLKLYWLERYFSFLKPLYFRVRKKDSPWWKDRLPWVPFDHYFHWTPGTIQMAVELAGFENVETHHFSKSDPWRNNSSGRGWITPVYRKGIDLLYHASGKTLAGLLIASGRKPEL